MLTLIEGGFFSGCQERIAKRIQELAKSGKKAILIVPEQQTVIAEAQFCDLLPGSAPLYFEATNFTRFANTVFRNLGGLTKKAASRAMRSVIIWRAMAELAPMLEGRAAREVSAGAVSRMLATVSQMQSLAIKPSELADAADTLAQRGGADARLISKLRDVSKIMALYKRILGESFSDGDDDLIFAEQKIAASESFLRDTEIFIDGFTSFTEPQYALISTLIKRTSVTLTLTIPKEYGEAYEYTETRKTRSRLLRICGKADVDLQRLREGGRDMAIDPLISQTAELIFRTSARIDEDSIDRASVKVYEARDPHEECDFVAADIKRRVMNEGARYSEFGIIARGTESYDGIIDSAFEKAGIPLFISSGGKIDSYEVIKLIYNAIEAISGGYRRRDVISYSKCSLCGLSHALADELELYTETWQISGERFTDGILWNMNPDGYTERRADGTDEYLMRIDAARRTVIEPLSALSDAFSSSGTVSEYAEALIGFLTSLGIEEKLVEKSREASILKSSSASGDMKRLWQLICDSLDGLCLVAGDLKTNPEEFLALLKITFAEGDIGRIPAFTEQVTFGDAKGARMPNKRYIYIIGANAGVFPATVSDDSFFTENDKRALSELGLPTDSDEDSRCASELYYFVRAISYAKGALTVTYHETDREFKPSPPSEVISRISELTGGRIQSVKVCSLPLSRRIYTPEYALEHISEAREEREKITKAIKDAGLGERLSISEKSIDNSKLKLAKETVNLLYGSTIRMSQSKLDRFVTCPMSYFCTYNLALRREERAEFDARNIGNFLHAVLENFFRELRLRGSSIGAITEEEKISLIRRVADDYIRGCFEGIPRAAARVRVTVERLCVMAKPIVDSLCDEFKDSSYEPVFFELEIDKNKEDCPTPSTFKTDDGREVYVAGKIDRVDLYQTEGETFVRVIDYKSGSKVFSPSDIEQGVNLQMFLYLKSVTESNNEAFLSRAGATGKKMVPAGVLYVKTDVRSPKIAHDSTELALEAVKSAQARMGMLLDESESLEAMNSSFIPIKFKKDGTPDANSQKRLYTRSGWESISKTVEDAVTNICNKILDGTIDASALAGAAGKSPCEYCEFKPICRKS